MVSVLAEIRRGWWAFALPGHREYPGFHTYLLDFNPLPPIDRPLDGDVRWLLAEPPVPDSLAEGHRARREATSEQLNLLLESRGLILPRSFRTFMELEEPRTRVRSCTDCYLDLGDFPVRVFDEASDKGWLLHFLSDQQWVLHWLLYCDDGGNEAVIVTDVPFGFEDADSPGPSITKSDLKAVESTAVCAESFSEFLWRFWMENEIWFALSKADAEPRPLTPKQSQYLAHYRR